MNTGNDIICNKNCNYRTAATIMYLKQTRFVSGTLTQMIYIKGIPNNKTLPLWLCM